MAFLVKTGRQPAAGPSTPGFSVVQQWIHVRRAGLLVPQSTSEILFKVTGGRIRVHLLLGEVTTIMPATDAQMSILSKKLNPAMDTAVGTALTIASTVTTANAEVGRLYVIEGDGTAIVASAAGGAFLGASGEVGPWIAPNGEIYITTAASSVTGAIQWDIWYQPLDEGASVVAVSTATAIV